MAGSKSPLQLAAALIWCEEQPHGEGFVTLDARLAEAAFGTVTILDREPGAGGLQIYSEADGWTDAPYDPDALTVNIGDLLEYWSGRRWPSGRHRVLPPQPHAPEEDLVSLIYFYEANHDALIKPMAPPVGRVSDLPPVTTSDFIKERLDAISVG